MNKTSRARKQISAMSRERREKRVITHKHTRDGYGYGYINLPQCFINIQDFTNFTVPIIYVKVYFSFVTRRTQMIAEA